MPLYEASAQNLVGSFEVFIFSQVLFDIFDFLRFIATLN